MERLDKEEDREDNYVDTLVEVVAVPLIRGISFGIAHLIAFSILGPMIFKKS